MAITTRVQTKGTLSATGTLSLGRITDNFPYEPATPALGTILGYTTTGTPASISLQFEGSADGSTGWTAIGSALTNTTSGSTSMLPPIQWPFVRASLNTFTGGTAPTVVITVTTQGGN